MWLTTYHGMMAILTASVTVCCKYTHVKMKSLNPLLKEVCVASYYMMAYKGRKCVKAITPSTKVTQSSPPNVARQSLSNGFWQASQSQSMWCA